MSGPLIGGDEVNAIVLDLGSYQVKAGYAGEDAPKFVFPSAVGAAGDAMEVDGAAAGRAKALRVGNQALAHRLDGVEVTSPFGADGAIEDWDAVEALWSHALTAQMRAKPTEHPLMLAEASDAVRAAREKMVELAFEKYNVPAVFVAKNAMLSSFAVARQTSLVVDVGHASTVVAAVHDGYVLNKSVIRTPLAGRLLTACTLAAVEARGAAVHPRYAVRRAQDASGAWKAELLDLPGTTASYREYARALVAEDAKHALCRVSDAPFSPEDKASIPTQAYELPDGQEVHLGAERFAIPEALFNPPLLAGFGEPGAAALAGGAPPGLPAAVAECIARCDVDVRRELYGGVVLGGGTALFAGLRERLERELAEGAPAAARVKVTSPANAVERRFGVWVGGSILASLGTFQQMWLSRAEYAELGAGGIHKKAV